VAAAFRQAHEQGAISELRGVEATEAAFRSTALGKRYVHLATHGFFAAPAGQPPKPPAVSELLSTLARQPTAGGHPGLLSGIALAGANQGAAVSGDLAQGDDGILTALEVADLDLRGAELVVLSACDTGQGLVAGGEGLFGLQRAFQLAGARAVVASMWKVDDEVTQRLMTRFYANLWQKQLPPLEALRQAQLSILTDGAGSTRQRGPGSEKPIPADTKLARAHPRLWAAWVLSGDPGELTVAAPAPIESEPPPPAESEPPVRWAIWVAGGSLTAVLLASLALWYGHLRVRGKSHERSG
jgi:CHAT domain-containing protein